MAGSLAEFKTAFRKDMDALSVLKPNDPYPKGTECIRKLLLSGTLKLTDIQENPDRFMAAHELISELAGTIGPGFFIRFTVQYNLFAGTVVAVGNDKQVAQLQKIQQEGKVGCFGLTEVFAGVNSGLVVETTATWNAEKQQFLLNTPTPGAMKNWISQGLMADLCVVVADLIVSGKAHGPHAFLMELRRDGKQVEGVELKDMGVKTIGNDLDNARIAFQNVWLPKDALLSRYADIEDNKYVQKQAGIRPMDMIGQRLYTGRIVIARSAVVFARQLYAKTQKYSDNKRCWAPKGEKMVLSQIPQLAHLYVDADKQLTAMETFVNVVEKQLENCLRAQKIPSQELIEAVASSKVKSIELVLDLCWRLKQEVGSYALMAGSGFDHMDILQCFKFAEGDSRILMSKMSRDRVKAFQKGFEGPAEEAELCRAILKGTADHFQVYGLAQKVIDRIVATFGQASAKL